MLLTPSYEVCGFFDERSKLRPPNTLE